MYRWYVLVLVGFAALALMPTVALAAGGGGGGDRIGVEQGLFKGAIEVSLWTILVFLLLLSVLRKYAWGPIREGLEKREQAIARDKKEAILARQEADRLRAELEKRMKEANEEIRAMIDKARSDAQQTAAEELARGKAELAAERERLHRELRLATDDALSKIWDQSTQLATLISTKAVRRQLSEADHRTLLAEALEEFRQAAEARKNNLQSAHA